MAQSIIDQIDKGLFGQMMDFLVHEAPGKIAGAVGRFAGKVTEVATAGVSGLIDNIGSVTPSLSFERGTVMEAPQKLGNSAKAMELQERLHADPQYAYHNEIHVPTVGAKGPSMGSSVMMG